MTATTAPEWVRPVYTPVVDRLVTMAYLVLRRSGLRERACRSICCTVLQGLIVESCADDAGAAGRMRADMVAALRTELGRTRQLRTVDTAVEEALLFDAMLALPPRQRFAVRSAVARHWSVTDIAEHTGWTRDQVHRLLRAGLKTVAAHRNPVDAPPLSGQVLP